MAYGFAQTVMAATPDEVFDGARRNFRDRGYEPGTVRRTRGYLGERLLRLRRGKLEGRLWVWPLGPGLSVVYLGLEEDLAPFAGPRLMRAAEELLEETREEAGGHLPLDLRVAA
jgi:hypothetical protein